MTDLWAEKPEAKTMPAVGYLIGPMDAWLEKLKVETQRAMEWLAYIDALDLQGGIAEIIGWKKKAEDFTFLFGEKGVKTKNLMKIQIWREKAERWDQYAIYDNDNEPKILVKDLITAYETLEATKKWLIKAKAEGRISMNVGFSLGLVLGVEE